MESNLKVIITDRWNKYLDKIPAEANDIYYSEEYVNLYCNDGGKAQCVICYEDDNFLLMPFVRKEIRGYYDFETAYGYGGYTSNVDSLEWNSRALVTAHNYLKDSNYVCGFMRLHPLIQNIGIYKEAEIGIDSYGILQVLYDRATIAIDVSKSEDEIWKEEISSKNRNMIRKAEKNGLVYKTEFDFESLDEFIDLYKETMKRLDAEAFYFFDKNYFEQFVDRLKGKTFLGTVRKEGKLICAALFMYSMYYGHYHLEGSDREYSSLGANNLLLWKVACEMHNLGIREFHLGGGTSSTQEDSLFKFKRAFSGNIKDFYIGKEIFNAPVYAALCDEWERQNIDKVEAYGGRLLKYRC